MSKIALGKGFEGLIPTGFNVEDVASPGEQIKQLPIEKVVPNPDQPRKEFDESSLKELAESIKQHGIIQPIVVTPSGDKFRIVAGERRYRASKIAGLTKLPAIIRNHKELEELEIALVENVQRVDLSPLEQALSIVRLRDQFSLTPKQISDKLGKAETTISNIVRLLQLPKQAVEALQKSRITEGHARAILALKNDEKTQIELLNTIIAHKLSVRQAEQFVQQKKNINSIKKTHTNSPPVKKLIDKIDKKLASKIVIKEKKEGGLITISYDNLKDLQNIIQKL